MKILKILISQILCAHMLSLAFLLLRYAVNECGNAITIFAYFRRAKMGV